MQRVRHTHIQTPHLAIRTYVIGLQGGAWDRSHELKRVEVHFLELACLTMSSHRQVHLQVRLAEFQVKSELETRHLHQREIVTDSVARVCALFYEFVMDQQP